MVKRIPSTNDQGSKWPTGSFGNLGHWDPGLLCCAFVLVLVSIIWADRVETFDARSFQGQVLLVDDKSVALKEADRTRTLSKAEVAEIVLGEEGDLMTRPGQQVLVTVCGDRLAAADLAAADGRIQFANPMLGRVAVEFGSAAMVYLTDSRATPAQIERKFGELRLSGAAGDVMVIAKKDDAWLNVEGVLKTIASDSVTFFWNQREGKVERKLVPVVRLSSPSASRPVSAGAITGVCGSTLSFTSLKVAGDEIAADNPILGAVKLHRAAVAAVRFVSGNVVELAALKPQAVREHGMMDKTFPHRLNRSVGGGELLLGGRSFRSGLGLHSFCELTWKLDGEYSAFAAVVGIDDAVRPLGSAAVVFLGDGRELTGPVQVSGKDAPATVRLDLKGVKEFTIRVDLGPDKLDVADHVDVAAPRLIK